MPLQGIESSAAAFSQAGFDQLKSQVDAGTVARIQELRQQTQEAFAYIPPPPTTDGPGGRPPAEYTTQYMNEMIRAVQASGYAALSLGSAWPPQTYQGHLLNGAFHTLDPVFGGLKADYRI
ncbi:MAG TPA: hypothetical protein VF157_03170 [Chloroflexota bacterium]